MTAIRKYPRTHHIEGSRLQPGDEDLDSVPFETLKDKTLVVEEKIDGANSAISFSEQGELLLQSRGHYLTGGSREKHFALLKTWASCHQATFHNVLRDRYVLYGEWSYAKHTVFYDSLPHYFLEFDILDRTADSFLSTTARRKLLAGLPVVSVPVLWSGSPQSLAQLQSLVRPSLYKSPQWREKLQSRFLELNLDPTTTWRETDPSDLSEGLYIKHEEADVVVARYKYIRASFLSSVMESKTHWLNRPIVPNGLADGVDLYRTEDS